MPQGIPGGSCARADEDSPRLQERPPILELRHLAKAANRASWAPQLQDRRERGSESARARARARGRARESERARASARERARGRKLSGGRGGRVGSRRRRTRPGRPGPG
ncbi:hypothetical protein EEZ25_05260 [Micromonospora aurantiaca]|nr:hypothetical protein EEZ25_05260 [Micromonospora aurantiaca]